MRNRILFTAIASLLALALPASAALAASPRAVVYSKATTVEGKVEGGLFAVKDGHLNQLTDDPADTEPAFSSDGRTIAFARDGDVWAMRADGSGQHALTAGPEIDGRPLVAANGRYVLFERRVAEGAARDLYTVSVGGGPAHVLAESLADERQASFSSDGRLIVFVRGFARPSGETSDLFSVGPSGDGRRRLTHTGAIDEFSPHYAGERIVFSRGRAGEGADAYADVYTMRRDGRKLRPLIRGAGSAYVEDVTPNGRLLLFRRAQGLWVKPLAGGRRGHRRARKLTEVADQSTTNAVFSSDGRKVAAFIATDEFESLAAVDVARRRATTLAAGFTLSSGEVATSIGPVIAWQPVRR
jgi:dipeptidyl aminopeptidase/acylaminoacyl peptidase